jgi:HK97 family phage major capsid protein
LLGEAWAKKLDYNIALGDGTTQPEGLFTAAGITTITCDNTTVGPPTLNDYTSLMFSIGKQYRQPGSCRFVSNDTTYARSRGIRVDPHAIGTTVNQTPVLSDVNSFMNYQTLGWGHSVQNDIANGRCIFGALKKYRMYRRTGLEIEVQTAGKTLALANKALITARARFAGRIVDASAFAKWTAGQS